MKINIFVRFGASWQEQWLTAFREGLKTHGVSSKICSTINYEECDVAVCWGLSHDWIALHKNLGKKLLVLERGYVGNREQWTAIGWNGINGNADFCLNKELGNRIKKLQWHFKDWQRNNTGIILIAGQVPGDNSVKHLKIDVVYQKIIRQLNIIAAKPIIFRPHPLSRKSFWKKVLDVPISDCSLMEDLHRAFVVITLNSNMGVDAIIEGVPVISLDKGSMVWDVSGHGVYDAVFPHYPDRNDWFKKLAYCQWNEKEIIDGYAWEHLNGCSNWRTA